MRLLFLGDVVGRPGRDALRLRLPSLRNELRADCVIANGENAAAGAGITERLARQVLQTGVDAITLGDHTWDQRGFDQEITRIDRLCRPANFPAAQPGRTHLILETAGLRLGIATLLGRVFVNTPSACPFHTAEELLAGPLAGCDAVFLEIHAEATAEKIAFGRAFDGRAALIAGTHTHVATADASLLPGGTAYITDVGMCGPHDSVLGREVGPVVARFRDGLPRKLPVATADVRLNGVLVEFDPAARRALSVQRIGETVELTPLPQPATTNGNGEAAD
jgi:metallophosphoesterase (TIGR00282 family)